MFLTDPVPVFSLATIETRVWENTAINTPLFQLLARAETMDHKQQALNYSIVSGRFQRVEKVM